MNEKTLLIQSGKKLLHEGFTVETWGNISVRGDERATGCPPVRRRSRNPSALCAHFSVM